MSRIFKISNKDRLIEPSPLKTYIHQFDAHRINNNLSTLIGAEQILTNYSLDTDTLSVQIDTVAMQEDQTPVFIYFNTQEKTDNIQKAIYQRDIMYDFKEMLRKDMASKGHRYSQIKWADTKSVVIGAEFKPHQTHLLTLTDNPIELYTYVSVGDNFIVFNQVETPAQKKQEVVVETKPKRKAHPDFRKTIDSLDTYTKRLYNNITSGMSQLSDRVTITETKQYARVKTSHGSINIYVNAKSRFFRIIINMDTTNVPFDNVRVKDIRNTGYNGDVELVVRSIEDYNAVVPIIKDALDV